jgi:hypothetical protein
VLALGILIAGRVVPAGATARTITLQWTAPGDDGWLGRANSYDIRYSRSPITSTNFAAATKLNLAMLPGVSGTTDRLSIFGLMQETAYYFAVRTKDEAGNWSKVSNIAYLAPAAAGVDGETMLPVSFSAPTPNPTNGHARFAVTMPKQNFLRVEAFDVSGRKVKTIAMGEYSAGRYDLRWDLHDDGGQTLAAGTYMVRGQLGEEVFLRRVTLLR